ncbi:metal-dependent hydrolase [Candidatus Nanohalococcus occultus]|uniref:Membrane-bound metal-dependent hydrolase YbcI, DUF457 family n=1 Tax=Candidatus Nanohalococcus occultus TaxID=2978047 RepID=A0ABY8CIV5_9ARCH|nr:Membrane-bound metal-dependent hydrolase YbcI, DUF457 family [Candidatus Nanohaloarchaeota archaeon SVXNc]
MGDFHEHVVFGFLAAAVTAYFMAEQMALTQLELFCSGLAVVTGSVLPDIDHKKAYAHRAAKSFCAVGSGITIIVYLSYPIHVRFILAALAFLLVYIGFSSIKFKHRGFTHSLSFMFLSTLAGIGLSAYFFASFLPGLALGVGILSHLTLDRHFKIS